MVVVVAYMWGAFDRLVLKVILRFSVHLSQKWPVTRKRLAVERKSEILDSGYLQHVYGGTFNLLMFKVILSSFCALVSLVIAISIWGTFYCTRSVLCYLVHLSQYCY